MHSHTNTYSLAPDHFLLGHLEPAPLWTDIPRSTRFHVHRHTTEAGQAFPLSFLANESKTLHSFLP